LSARERAQILRAMNRAVRQLSPYALLVTLGCAGTVACGSSKPDAATPSGSLTATINGAARTFDLSLGGALANNQATIVIAGQDQSSSFRVSFPNVVADSFACGTATQMQYATLDGSSVWVNGALSSCTVTIAKYGGVGTTIEGSFSGTLQAETGADAGVVVTAGSFSVTIAPAD
jgi:hypothetical protein